MKIAAGRPYKLTALMPSNAAVGKPAWCIIRAEGYFGNPARRYNGTISFKATDTTDTTGIEIKKNSSIVHVVRPKKRIFELNWREPDFDSNKTCYYYIRIVQSNNEEAISSPIWVN